MGAVIVGITTTMTDFRGLSSPLSPKPYMNLQVGFSAQGVGP